MQRLIHLAQGKSIGLIGNSGILNERCEGSQIDSTDLIVRINCPPLEGFERHCGSRTDILFSNLYQDEISRPRLEQHQPKLVVGLVTVRESAAQIEKFLNWSRPYPTWITAAPDLINFRESQKSRLSLMTGTYALALIVQHCHPKNIRIWGFNFFDSKTDDHFWDSKPQRYSDYHDPRADREVCASLCQRSAVPVHWENGLGSKPVQRPFLKNLMRRLSKSFLETGNLLRNYS